MLGRHHFVGRHLFLLLFVASASRRAAADDDGQLRDHSLALGSERTARELEEQRRVVVLDEEQRVLDAGPLCRLLVNESDADLPCSAFSTQGGIRRVLGPLCARLADTVPDARWEHLLNRTNFDVLRSFYGKLGDEGKLANGGKAIRALLNGVNRATLRSKLKAKYGDAAVQLGEGGADDVALSWRPGRGCMPFAAPDGDPGPGRERACVLHRGGCQFRRKALHAKLAGCAALLIVDHHALIVDLPRAGALPAPSAAALDLAWPAEWYTLHGEPMPVFLVAGAGGARMLQALEVDASPVPRAQGACGSARVQLRQPASPASPASAQQPAAGSAPDRHDGGGGNDSVQAAEAALDGRVEEEPSSGSDATAAADDDARHPTPPRPLSPIDGSGGHSGLDARLAPLNTKPSTWDACRDRYLAASAADRSARRGEWRWASGHPRHTHGLAAFSATGGFAYVAVPKAASTSSMARARAAPFRASTGPLSLLRRSSPEELRAAYAFSFVREPLARLLSAFGTVNKRALSTEDSELARAQRANHGGANKTYLGEPELLARFDAFLADTEADRGWDEHVASQMYYLSANLTRGDDAADWGGEQLDFNFLGRIENTSAVWSILSERLGVADPTSEHAGGAEGARSHERKNVLEGGRAFRLQQANLTDAQLRRICALYRWDYECIGFVLPAACANMTQPAALPTIRADSCSSREQCRSKHKEILAIRPWQTSGSGSAENQHPEMLPVSDESVRSSPPTTAGDKKKATSDPANDKVLPASDESVGHVPPATAGDKKKATSGAADDDDKLLLASDEPIGNVGDEKKATSDPANDKVLPASDESVGHVPPATAGDQEKESVDATARWLRLCDSEARTGIWEERAHAGCTARFTAKQAGGEQRNIDECLRSFLVGMHMACSTFCLNSPGGDPHGSEQQKMVVAEESCHQQDTACRESYDMGVRSFGEIVLLGQSLSDVQARRTQWIKEADAAMVHASAGVKDGEVQRENDSEKKAATEQGAAESPPKQSIFSAVFEGIRADIDAENAAAKAASADATVHAALEQAKLASASDTIKGVFVKEFKVMEAEGEAAEKAAARRLKARKNEAKAADEATDTAKPAVNARMDAAKATSANNMAQAAPKEANVTSASTAEVAGNDAPAAVADAAGAAATAAAEDAAEAVDDAATAAATSNDSVPVDALDEQNKLAEQKPAAGEIERNGESADALASAQASKEAAVSDVRKSEASATERDGEGLADANAPRNKHLMRCRIGDGIDLPCVAALGQTKISDGYVMLEGDAMRYNAGELCLDLASDLEPAGNSEARSDGDILREFYWRKNPRMLTSVDKLLRQHSAQELVASIEKAYGEKLRLGQSKKRSARSGCTAFGIRDRFDADQLQQGVYCLLARGNCPFGRKAAHAQDAGCAGLVVLDSSSAGDLTPPDLGEEGARINIPVVMLRHSKGVADLVQKICPANSHLPGAGKCAGAIFFYHAPAAGAAAAVATATAEADDPLQYRRKLREEIHSWRTLASEGAYQPHLESVHEEWSLPGGEHWPLPTTSPSSKLYTASGGPAKLTVLDVTGTNTGLGDR